jgi:hypothetical protein
MGRASSSKKVARAARTAGRPGESKKWTWPVAIGAVVLLGVALVVVSRPDNPEPIPPRLGDHWHAAYGINLCGEWLPPLQDQRPDDTGIHTHGDGLLHMHPFSTRASGAGANLNTFGDMVGLEIGDGTLTVPGGIQFTDGEDCEGDLAGEPGIVQVMVWDDPSATEGRLIDDDPGSYAPQDGEVITIAFLPEGAEIEMPPTVPRLQDPLAAEEGRQPIPIDDPSVPDAPDDAIVEEVEPGADASPEDGEGGFIEDPGLDGGGEPTDP